MTLVPQFSYLAPTKPFQNWLRLTATQPFAAMVGAPNVDTARIVGADLLPAGIARPAVAFHAAPGGSFDQTLTVFAFQFDCYADTAPAAEQLAGALASLLASTPPRTSLGGGLTFEGPADLVDSFYLPVQTSRLPRQILRARLTFAAY